MAWFSRNASAIEAASALITALVAVMALVGVKLQIDAAHQQTLEQGARDLYREHLTHTMQNPQFSDPGTCPAFSEDAQAAYGAYVTHLIYTAEETIAADPTWEPVMAEALSPHAAFLCTQLGTDASLTAPVNAMLREIALTDCAQLPQCDN